MRLFLASLTIASFCACSRVPLPQECRNLDDFLKSQAEDIAGMQKYLSSGNMQYLELRAAAQDLVARQDVVLGKCQAEITARGNDCKQASQARIISNSRAQMRAIVDLQETQGDAIDSGYLKELVRFANEDANKASIGKLCE